LEGSSRNWSRLAAVLAGRSVGHAPDLPGSGMSPPPRRRYSIAADARLVARLIESAGEGAVHLVGNSRGGVVATVLAAEFPQLVRTLTLISPAVPDFRVFGERGANVQLALVMLPGATGPVRRLLESVTPEDRARGLALTCFGEPEALSLEDLAAVAADSAERRSSPWAADDVVRSLRSLIRAQLRPGRWSLATAARTVTQPTLVVWGTRDRLVDCRLAQRTAAAFADSRLLMLARTGHVAQMERPVEVARAMLALWEDATARPRRAGAPVPPVRETVAT
jgi:pimeloyl-ACP methyl ester carboxylesterase